MRYIRHSKFNEQKSPQEKLEAENDLYVKQSNILIDQLVKSRDYINNRIKEVFDYDVNNSVSLEPFPCYIVVHDDVDGDDQMFDVASYKDLQNYRRWGKFLQNVEGKCEIDFVITYTLYLPSGFKYKKKRTVDETLLDYERHAEKLIELSKKLRVFKEDLGDLKIHELHDIDTMNRYGEYSINGYGEYSIMFELRRKNIVSIDPIKWFRKINT